MCCCGRSGRHDTPRPWVAQTPTPAPQPTAGHDSFPGLQAHRRPAGRCAWSFGGGGAAIAQAVRYVCRGCGRAIEAWSDGNPNYLDESGGKHYAYHPDHENLARCVGNDSPHLCLGCGAECKVDSRAPIPACPTCGAAELMDTYQLTDQRCPYCKAGAFAVDPEFRCVS